MQLTPNGQPRVSKSLELDLETSLEAVVSGVFAEIALIGDVDGEVRAAV